MAVGRLWAICTLTGLSESLSQVAAWLGHHYGKKARSAASPASKETRMSVRKPISNMWSAWTKCSNLGQAQVPFPEMIKQAAGTGDDDLHAGTDFLDLRQLADPAVNCHAAKAGLLGERVMSSWICSASSRVGATMRVRTLLRGPGKQMLQNGQGEGRGLAGAGLGQAHDVAAGEKSRHSCSWMGVEPVFPAAIPAAIFDEKQTW